MFFLAVFSATSFRNFSNVNVRRDFFGFVVLFFLFPVFLLDFNSESHKIRSSRAPNICIAGFCLFWATSFQRLHSGAIRSLLLMRSLTDSAELFTGMELHISACCPNQTELCTKSIEKTACFPF